MKRWLLIAALLLTPHAALAQLQPSAGGPPAYVAQQLTPWKCSLNAIAATLTQCQAVSGAGIKSYIRTIHVQTTTTTSGTYAVQTGTGANCATGTTALFPSSATANRFNAPPTTAGMVTITFDPPLDPPAASAICVIGVATNTISIQMEGFQAQ